MSDIISKLMLMIIGSGGININLKFFSLCRSVPDKLVQLEYEALQRWIAPLEQSLNSQE